MSVQCPREFLLLTSLLAICACRGESTPDLSPSWAAVLDTIGDTVLVRTLSGSRWEDTAYLVPEMTIGTFDGADEYVLGNPSAFAVTEGGGVLILDNHLPLVRMYDSSGVFFGNLGREGSGPGEYKSPDGVAVLLDGRILVRDPPNSRIAVFGKDGSYLYQWPLSGGFNSGNRFYVDHDGNSYVTALKERGLSPWDWEITLVRYSPEGEIIDSIPEPVWEYEAPQLTAQRENSSTSRDVPFSPRATSGFSPAGYWVSGLSTDYRIDHFRADGRVLRIEKVWEPVLVSQAEAEERRREMIGRFQRQYGTWRWNGPPIPEEKPPFKEIFLSWEGNTWVGLSTPGVPTMSLEEAREEEAATGRAQLRFTEPWVFDVFSTHGEYLGPLKPPAGFQVQPEPMVRGNRVWAVTRDALDIPRLVRFRIEVGTAPPDSLFLSPEGGGPSP